MSINSFFDESGRFLPELTSKEVNKNSRNYFVIGNEIRNEINNKKIFDNLQKYFGDKIKINFNEFLERLNKIQLKTNNNIELKNIDKAVNIPFIIPIIENHSDIGSDISNILIPKLKISYENEYPLYNFSNHCSENLKNQINISKKSRYLKIIEKIKFKNIVGILYLNLNEFSFPAAEEIIEKMPEDFNLSGPYEIFSSLIGFPNLLYKKEKYPPLLWISSIKDKYLNDTGYHIEPYGYNLTFNKRPHLNKAAEYWWHSISITD